MNARGELVTTVCTGLKNMSDGLMEALKKPEATADMRLTGFQTTLLLTIAVGLVESMHKSESVLRDAVTAAVESLSEVPGANATVAMLQAALNEKVTA